MITYIHYSLLGITEHICGPSLSLYSAFGFETLCRFLFLQPCQNVISGVDSCPRKTLMWGQALGQRERERRRGIFPSCLRSLLSVSSSHLSMLTAIWSYYLSRCDRFMCDVLCALWGFLCGREESVCSISKTTPGGEAGQGTGNVKLLMGCCGMFWTWEWKEKG